MISKFRNGSFDFKINDRDFDIFTSSLNGINTHIKVTPGEMAKCFPGMLHPTLGPFRVLSKGNQWMLTFRALSMFLHYKGWENNAGLAWKLGS